MLVYYIHHVARIIQADDMVARVGGDVVEPDDRAALQRAHLAALAACRIQPVGVRAASRGR